jgi:hypothetical protein
VRNEWDPVQKRLFNDQSEFENSVVEIINNGDRAAAIQKMTDYTLKWGNYVFKKAWELGDRLWNKYDERF